MSLQTSKFDRKPVPPVEAIQVTPENIMAVADWCGGVLHHDGEKEGNLSRDYIKVKVQNPLNDKQTQAYFGDWVLRRGKSFKVYTNQAFHKSFTAAKKSSHGPKPQAPKNRPVQEEAK